MKAVEELVQKLLDNTINERPVIGIQRVTEEWYGIQVMEKSLGNILGYLDMENDSRRIYFSEYSATVSKDPHPVIILNETNKEEENRYTIGYLLGVYLMNESEELLKKRYIPVLHYNSSAITDLERVGKQFAAGVLVPSQYIGDETDVRKLSENLVLKHSGDKTN